MNIKKLFRIAGKVLLILLLLIIILLLITTLVYHIKLSKVEKQLREADYYDPVFVGDHALNVYACGNENGRHTIVALAGLGDGEMFLGWRQMTAEIEKDNRLIFIDRAGYGLSDDTNTIRNTMSYSAEMSGRIRPTYMAAVFASNKQGNMAVFPMIWGFTVEQSSKPELIQI